jgi:hypothetical protein
MITMNLSRRKFLGLTMKGIFLIGAGNTLQSFSNAGFLLPDRNKIRLRFAIASDGHYGQEGTEFKATHTQMVEWLNKEQAERGVDFSFINGDLFHNDPIWLPEVKKQFDGLKMRYYVSHGNHDNTDEATWEKNWKMPLNYSFEKQGSAFLVLDTADETGKSTCPDLKWTRDQLTRYQANKELFIFMHITPFKWTGGGHPSPELVELFDKQSNLKGVFHGHDHTEDGFKENKGKFYFFDSHIGGDWGTDYHGYRIVEVLKNGEILTYQMDGAKGQKVNERRVP